MEEYKSINKYLNKKNINSQESNVSRNLKKHISKFLIICILFLLFLIFSKLDKGFKTKFYDYVYNNNFSFAKVNKWYKDNFGELFPLENFLVEDTLVFSEKLTYESSNIYKDGVSLKVSDNYLVSVLESGIVIFVGEKEGYGNTVIVQQENGIDVWYSNINYSNINMYDYVEKSSFIGEVKDNNLILIFQKDGEYLDYKDYI